MKLPVVKGEVIEAVVDKLAVERQRGPKHFAEVAYHIGCENPELLQFMTDSLTQLDRYLGRISAEQWNGPSFGGRSYGLSLHLHGVRRLFASSMLATYKSLQAQVEIEEMESEPVLVNSETLSQEESLVAASHATSGAAQGTAPLELADSTDYLLSEQSLTQTADDGWGRESVKAPEEVPASEKQPPVGRHADTLRRRVKIPEEAGIALLAATATTLAGLLLAACLT